MEHPAKLPFSRLTYFLPGRDRRIPRGAPVEVWRRTRRGCSRVATELRLLMRAVPLPFLHSVSVALLLTPRNRVSLRSSMRE
jgi:hypothetical protein